MKSSPAMGARSGRFQRVCALLAVGVLAGAVLATPAGTRRQNRAGGIRVQTDLVSILVSVTDAKGRPVLDIPQDAFQLSEEGVPQKIERFESETSRPLDLALMVDSSMSALKDLKFETEAAAHFIRQVVRPATRSASSNLPKP